MDQSNNKPTDQIGNNARLTIGGSAPPTATFLPQTNDSESAPLPIRARDTRRGTVETEHQQPVPQNQPTLSQTSYSTPNLPSPYPPLTLGRSALQTAPLPPITWTLEPSRVNSHSPQVTPYPSLPPAPTSQPLPLSYSSQPPGSTSQAIRPVQSVPNPQLSSGYQPPSFSTQASAPPPRRASVRRRQSHGYVANDPYRPSSGRKEDTVANDTTFDDIDVAPEPQNTSAGTAGYPHQTQPFPTPMGQVSTPRPPTSTSVYPQLPQTSTQPILSQPPVGPIYSTPIPTNDNPYRPPQQTEPVPVAQPPQPISSGTPLPYPTSGPQRYHSSIDNPASSESQLPNPYSTIGQPAVPDVPSQTAQRPEQGRYGTPLPYPTSGPRLSSPAQYPAGSDSHLPNPYSGAGQPPVIVPPGDDGQSTYSGHHPDQDWDNRRDDDGRHTPLSTIEEYTEPPSRPTSVRPPPRLDTQDSYNPPSATSPRPSYQDPWMPPSNPYGDATSSPYIYPPVYPYEPYGQTPYNLPEEDETACDKCGACLGKSLGILVWVLFWPILLPYMFCRRRKHEADNAGVHYPVATDEEAPGGSLYSKPESKLEVAVRYSTREIPKEVYNLFLLRLPSLYFSRVARIFEEADLSLSELKKMALETATKSNSYGPSAYFLEAHSNLPPVYESLKNTWEGFIDSVMREWKTFNIISVLLLSAILTILQIDAASNDGLTRYTAMASLVCALMSLLYGCVYIIRFGTMRKPYKAAEWALEAKKSRTLIFWNVWVLLAMPAVWLSWSLILYVCCIMSFLWRTSALDVDDTRPMSKSGLLAARVVITILLSLGIVYGALVVLTFRRYGEIMDRKWKQRIDGWIDAKINQELPPLPVDSYPPPALPYNQNPQTAHSLPYGYQPSTQQSAQPPSVYSTPASHSSYYPTPYSHSQPKTGYSGYSTYGPPPASWDKADKAPSYHEHEAFSDYYYSADRKASSADDSTPVPSPKVPAASAPQVDAPGSPDSLKSMYLPDSVAGAAQPLSASGTQDSSQPAPSQIATPSQQAVGTTPSGKSSTIDIEVAEPSSTSQSETSSSKRPYISIPPPPPPPPLPPKPSAWSRNTDTLILPSPAHAYDRNSPSSSIGVSPAGSMIRSYSGGGQSETSLLIRKEHSDGSDASGPASVHKERDGGHEQDSWKRASVDSFNDRLDEVLKSRK